MKRLGLTLVAALCLAATTFAAGNQPTTAIQSKGLRWLIKAPAMAQPANVPSIVMIGRNTSRGFRDRKLFKVFGSLPILIPTQNMSPQRA